MICPCGSGNLYSACCQPFHEGKSLESALELMRSRYSAYALHLPAYIIQTIHPANPQFNNNLAQWTQEISDFCRDTQFKKLDILNFEDKGNIAFVTFTAHLIQNNQDASFTEKSCFKKLKDRWLYQSGQIID